MSFNKRENEGGGGGGGQWGLASSIDFTSLVLLGFLLFITIRLH